jgi:glyoxylase-like metal-dependent hydrolase (beta-lactamase superfamily II)
MRHFDDLDRRRFLLTGAVGLAAAALPFRFAYTATPLHRFEHGTFKIAVVSDGFLKVPANVLLPDAPRDELAAQVKAAGESADDLKPATNITLIDTGSDLILVDAGSGQNFVPSAGKLSENLKEAGIDPAKITKVVFTHAHPDHLWGLADGDTLRFPNADFHVGAAEWKFWSDGDIKQRLPEPMHFMINGAAENLARIQTRVKQVKGGDEIATGVQVLDTPGHTPGHISLQLAGGDGLVVVGDALGHAQISFSHPEWRHGFDTVSGQAIETRHALLDRAAKEKTKLIGYHFPYPGVGFVERKDGAYRFVAA